MIEPNLSDQQNSVIRDIRHLVSESPQLACSIALEVQLRRALCVIVNARAHELRTWKTTSDEASLLSGMTEIAVHKSRTMGTPTASEVVGGLLNRVVPAVDIFCRQFQRELDAGKSSFELYPYFCQHISRQGVQDMIDGPTSRDGQPDTVDCAEAGDSGGAAED